MSKLINYIRRLKDDGMIDGTDYTMIMTAAVNEINGMWHNTVEDLPEFRQLVLVTDSDNIDLARIDYDQTAGKWCIRWFRFDHNEGDWFATAAIEEWPYWTPLPKMPVKGAF